MAYFQVETRHQPGLLYSDSVEPKPRRLVLRGRVVTMNDNRDVIQDGMVCIENKAIALVSQWPGTPPPPFDTAPIVETKGTIYPGLIELHNHPAYNVLPMWPVPPPYEEQPYKNRKKWRDNDNYKRRVSRPGKLLSYHPNADYPKALVRYVECKALLGGVTTTQGFKYVNDAQATYFDGLVRNVEFPNKDGWPVATEQLNDFETKDEASGKLTPILGCGKPLLMHVSEGTDGDAIKAFYFLQRDDGSWLIGPELICIHSTGLNDPELQVLARHRAGGIVWSPLSNYLLYGSTTKIDLVRKYDIPVAIGSDWAPSGTKNLLGELKIAKLAGAHACGALTDRELVEAVTRTAAKMLGWDSYVGAIEPRKTADILILDSTQSDPYANLIHASESNMIAVLIDGRPRAGRALVVDPRTPGVELITIANQRIVLDIVDSADHPLAGVSLCSAITRMTDALARLPDVAREAHERPPSLAGIVDQWRPVADYEETEELSPFAPPTLPQPHEVDPLAIEPITAVDDTEYAARIKNGFNVPQWLKDGL